MSARDELDVVLRRIKNNGWDWSSLADVLDVKKSMPIKYADRPLFFNRAIRHGAYGHWVSNVFRDEYSPDYSIIVKAVASKLKIKIDKDECIEDMEEKIVAEVLRRIRESIIKKEGQAAWDRMEEEAKQKLEEHIRSGKIPRSAAGDVFNKAAPGTLMAALFAGKLAGFSLYIVANQLFFAVARYAGLHIGVAVAGPIIGKTLAFLLGPKGWAIAAIWLLLSIGDTNWKKTIAAVTMIAIFRQKQNFEKELDDRKRAFQIAQEIGG